MGLKLCDLPCRGPDWPSVLHTLRPFFFGEECTLGDGQSRALAATAPAAVALPHLKAICDARAMRERTPHLRELFNHFYLAHATNTPLFFSFPNLQHICHPVKLIFISRRASSLLEISESNSNPHPGNTGKQLRAPPPTPHLYHPACIGPAASSILPTNCCPVPDTTPEALKKNLFLLPVSIWSLLPPSLPIAFSSC